MTRTERTVRWAAALEMLVASVQIEMDALADDLAELEAFMGDFAVLTRQVAGRAGLAAVLNTIAALARRLRDVAERAHEPDRVARLARLERDTMRLRDWWATRVAARGA